MEGGGQPGGPVLVVEDHAGQHAHLLRSLGARGHDVRAAHGDAALAELSDAPPDAVLVGASLAPAVLLALEHRHGVPVAPVVVLSGGADAEGRAALLHAGALQCVPDPVDPLELEAVVAGALALKRSHDTLLAAIHEHERDAVTDPLTGMGNRRLGERELEQLVARASRHGHALAVIEVDVDGFKDVNDTHGHEAGDRVLRDVAGRLAGCLRGGDVIARWGAEEFLAMLPDTGAAGAMRTAERLRRSVCDEPFRIGPATIELTVSVGWADWRGEDTGELMLRVDRALHEATAAGSNIVRPGLHGSDL